ncbi:MAG TPA: undecaprenyldiphospho-muramoylpentapeptide beta-N-acetylglucosaminyltransferase [Cyclobacteriaceae bacterium]|nr:undecaprenyldiphospho-muramoylpentapeptide beta-N-acetylglucosaminyltransferase [Cyclobacteriaceae bacterium]
MKNGQPYRLIISGGGTGGHVFPALAIAATFKERHPDAEILFVGAKGKMEMTKVPEMGFKIIGLWISGLQRKLSMSNLLFPFKLLSSYLKAKQIVSRFKPHVVVGTGGYASGPVMMAANRMKIPSLIQEQNSYAGLTNRKLAGKASAICVAYPNMEKYFDEHKVRLTGNPVRKDILDLSAKKNKALDHFMLSGKDKTLLIIGGSLGARTINQSILAGLDKLIDANVQVVWQTGRFYYEQIQEQTSNKDLRRIRIFDFIREMDLAYAVCDAVISRSGALAISELCVAGKPAILVPSPNVAEDHQTKNAKALVDADAALMVSDAEAGKKLVDEALKLLHDHTLTERLSKNIKALGKPNATEDIVNEIEKLVACN